MNARHERVLTFLNANTDTIDAASVAGPRQTLESVIAQITGFAQDQLVKGTESVVAQSPGSPRTRAPGSSAPLGR